MSRSKLLYLAVFVLALGWLSQSPAYGAGPASSGASAGQPMSVFDEGGQDADIAPAVSVSPLGEIDLHVKDLDLSKVLQLLSIQAQRNIVASRNVAGKVSADLYGVDFYEAMDAILHPNGFGYQEKGNFIYVYTQQELVAIQEAERQLSTKIVRLSYITAADASTFVSPLLSAAGSIAVSGAPAAGFEASSGDGGANSFAHADTLVIRDYPENVAEIVAVLKDLDQRPIQVLIESTILEATLTENNELGVDLSVMADFSMTQFADPLNIVDELVSGAVGASGGAGHTSVGNSASTKASVKFGVVNDDFAVFIQAMDTVKDVTVLANPKLLVLNRQRAKLLVGERKGYISTTATDTSTTQTVEFLELGTQLSVRPFVGDDDFIRLEIKPEISSGDVGLLGSFVVPQSTNQELTTNVMVRNGQTVILGGLFKEATTVNRRQVPFLGDVPLLGAAFRGQDDLVNRSEYIFLVTPTIMKDKALYAAGDRALDSVELVKLGARESLLPFSRSKMTAGHIREAVKHMEAGDDRRALWSANMALGLDDTSYEARRLKEQITGSRKWYPERSMLNDAVKTMVNVQLEAAAANAELVEPDAGAIDVTSTNDFIQPADPPAQVIDPQATGTSAVPVNDQPRDGARVSMPTLAPTQPAPTAEDLARSDREQSMGARFGAETQQWAAEPPATQAQSAIDAVADDEVQVLDMRDSAGTGAAQGGADGQFIVDPAMIQWTDDEQAAVSSPQPAVNMLEMLNAWTPADSADQSVADVRINEEQAQ